MIAVAALSSSGCCAHTATGTHVTSTARHVQSRKGIRSFWQHVAVIVATSLTNPFAAHGPASGQEIWDRPALVPVVITVPMSAFESIPIALAGGPSTGPSALADKLNARELEILRLLAAGHTVKSIAVRLSRSEASINERLRDARRKAGVGSSRELARLLDEQKIWDKNPDLAPLRSSEDTRGQPANRRRFMARGKLIMLVTIPVIAAGSLLMLADAPFRAARPQAASAISTSTAARSSPLVGSWALDVASVPQEERPRSVTISFSVAPDARWTTHVEIINADGMALHAKSTAALDAAPVVITGNMPFIDSGSLRQPAPGTLVLTLAKDGAPVSTRVYTASQDHRSMTETIIWAGSAMPKLETNTFRRIG